MGLPFARGFHSTEICSFRTCIRLEIPLQEFCKMSELANPQSFHLCYISDCSSVQRVTFDSGQTPRFPDSYFAHWAWLDCELTKSRELTYSRKADVMDACSQSSRPTVAEIVRESKPRVSPTRVRELRVHFDFAYRARSPSGLRRMSRSQAITQTGPNHRLSA